MDRVTIRKLNRGDAQKFFDLRSQGLKLHPEAFGQDLADFVKIPIEQTAQRCEPQPDGTCIIGAFNSTEEILGCVGMARRQGAKNQHKAFIWGMVVDADHRQKQIGRQLLQHAISEAKQSGIAELTLAVVTTNGAAIRLYESLGFIDYGLEPRAIIVNGQAYDEKLMRLPLDS